MNAALWLLLVVAPLTAAAQAAEGERGDLAGWSRKALAQAVHASAEIPDPFHKAQSLAEIAEAHAGSGDSVTALSLLQLAVDSAGSIDNEALESWARHDIALAYVKAGELTSAVSTTDSIKDLRLRDSVFAAIVDSRRVDHDFPGALTAARRMQDVAREGQALRSIVIAQASRGDVEGALVTARSIVHPTFSAVALGDVVAAFAKERAFNEARMLATRIRDERIRSNALVEVTAAQAEAGDVDGAFVTANGIEDKLSRSEALAGVAAGRMRSGASAPGRALFAQAVALAKGARGAADRKCSALAGIARAQISVAEMSAARETLQLALASLTGVKRNSDRLNLLAQIAPMQARVGDHAGAMATAWRADDPSLRPLLVRDVAAVQAEAGDVAGAVSAARKLEDRPAGAAAFFGILRAQSQAQDLLGMRATVEEALHTVRVIHSEELRAGALGSLAAAQMVAGDEDGAAQLFDEAMSVAARTEPPPARAAAYARIADALGERGR